ncbi:MAG: response regulator transcription factor [Clostridia bacterium]|nr:response regulator transcription factor [Clostridia bacterium]MBR3554123.1 response regulator transcription factor [Clostridia bacterium]
MRIALCDDEPNITEDLEQRIRAYAFKRDYEIECERFTDGRDLLERGKFDLYFLDFCMDAMNGIELAQALKEKYSHAVTICYLTNYDAAAAQIINQGIHAEGFLRKPVDDAQLEEKLDQFYRLSFFNRFELRRGKRYQTVFAQDILYVEADNKQVKLHLFDGVESYNYLLRDLEKLLPAGLFYRIQRSYLVNLQYVDSYDAKSVTLKNGETLPLKAKDFQRAYHNFMFLFNH